MRGGASRRGAGPAGWLPPRPPDAHKGRFGHVLIAAGSRGMTGAAVLCARAALRGGCGLATVAVPASQQAAVSYHVAEALTVGLPETPDGTLREDASARLAELHRARAFRVLALGPGLGSHPEAGRAVLAILEALKLPAVVDADGLNHLAAQPREAVAGLLRRRGAPCVITPHPGEMARLAGRGVEAIEKDRLAAARALAAELGCVCLLKGHRTVVTDGSRVFLNRTGNSGLAKGGSGDVLTGLIAGLWSQRLALDAADRGFEAAALGAYVHGSAADSAAGVKTEYALLASDVIEALPAAIKKLVA